MNLPAASSPDLFAVHHETEGRYVASALLAVKFAPAAQVGQIERVRSLLAVSPYAGLVDPEGESVYRLATGGAAWLIRVRAADASPERVAQIAREMLPDFVRRLAAVYGNTVFVAATKDRVMQQVLDPAVPGWVPVAVADLDGENGSRALRGSDAVRGFQSSTHCDDDDALSDLLADLMHHSDREGPDFTAALQRATLSYELDTAMTGQRDDTVARVLRGLLEDALELRALDAGETGGRATRTMSELAAWDDRLRLARALVPVLADSPIYPHLAHRARTLAHLSAGTPPAPMAMMQASRPAIALEREAFLTSSDRTSQATHSSNGPADFRQGDGANAIPFARDGRRITGTVEVAYITGSLASITRDIHSEIQYEFTDDALDPQHATYDTLKAEDGQPFFFAEDGLMVAAGDVVLVSPGLVEAFLASRATLCAAEDASAVDMSASPAPQP
jgi:hypothetical protein